MKHVRIAAVVLLFALPLVGFAGLTPKNVTGAQEGCVLELERSPNAATQTSARVGAYYFDGWAGPLTAETFEGLLGGSFQNRQPLYGWLDNTPCAIEQQLVWASQYGINFFVFLWYYKPEQNPRYPDLNSALRIYRALNNHHGVGYALVYGNAKPLLRIPSAEWASYVNQWVEMFADPDYVRVDGKPLFMILAPGAMRQSFGANGVKPALETLRAAAKAHGFPGVFIVGDNSGPPNNSFPNTDRFPDLTVHAAEGYDAINIYGYEYVQPVIDGRRPYSDLVATGKWIWEQTALKSPLPYIAVVMDGWDPRPWNEPDPQTGRLMWYDRSPEEFAAFVRDATTWAESNPRMRLEASPTPPLIILTAWNELGEGSYIVPTVGDGHRYGDALAQVLLEPATRVRTVLNLDATPAGSDGRREATGKLADAGGNVITGATVELSATPLDGPGEFVEYTLSGVVPSGTTQALVGFRVNDECGCSGTNEFFLYEARYVQGNESINRVPNGSFSQELQGWEFWGTGTAAVERSDRGPDNMLHVKATPSQTASINSSAFSVTVGTTYTVTFAARVAPVSVGSGYFAVFLLKSSGEGQRIKIPFAPRAISLGSATTDVSGAYRFSFNSPSQLILEASYSGDDRHWPAYTHVTR